MLNRKISRLGATPHVQKMKNKRKTGIQRSQKRKQLCILHKRVTSDTLQDFLTASSRFGTHYAQPTTLHYTTHIYTKLYTPQAQY